MRVEIELKNPLHFVKAASIVEEDPGYGFWLYIQGQSSYTESVRSMQNFIDVYRTVRAAKVAFSKHAYPGGKWS